MGFPVGENQFHITVLGSGTSTGVPTVGCTCAVCTSQIPRNNRTRCSLLVSHAGGSILIDSSTDLRQQALREGVGRIDAVLYTHAHADHVNGIDDLRPFNMVIDGPLPIFGTQETIAAIRRIFAYIFDESLEPGYRPNLVTQPLENPTSLLGLPVQPIPLQHGPGTSQGYRFGPFAYLTDCSGIPEESTALLAGLDTVIVDGLRWRHHDTHFNIPQAVAAMQELGIRRIILTHLSHDVDHHHHSSRLPDGVEFAYDGMKLHFCL